MSSKKRISEENIDMHMFDDSVDPEETAKSFPIDITEGKTLLKGYVELPCNQLIPYQRKDNSDFKPMSENKFSELVQSIKAYGVMEPISVRQVTNGKYEILAGEHRWKASKEVGNKTIPAHVLIADDDMAASYYAITNICRRDSTITDRINGYWHWLRAEQGNQKEALKLVNNDLSEADQLQIRQIQKLAHCHDLIPELLNKIDTPFLSVNAGYALSFLTDSQQNFIASLNRNIPEKIAVQIKELKENGQWSDIAVEEIINGEPGKRDSRMSLMVRKVKSLTKEYIRPEDYQRADEIFTEALNLYFEKHPDEKREIPLKPTKQKR